MKRHFKEQNQEKEAAEKAAKKAESKEPEPSMWSRLKKVGGVLSSTAPAGAALGAAPQTLPAADEGEARTRLLEAESAMNKALDDMDQAAGAAEEAQVFEPAPQA